MPSSVSSNTADDGDSLRKTSASKCVLIAINYHLCTLNLLYTLKVIFRPHKRRL